MPIYVWESDKGDIIEVYRTISRRRQSPTKEEGRKKGHKYKRCITNKAHVEKELSDPIISDAMAINPEDVPAHRKAHPTVPIQKDGRIGPIRTYSEHRRVMKELGFVNRSG